MSRSATSQSTAILVVPKEKVGKGDNCETICTFQIWKGITVFQNALSHLRYLYTFKYIVLAVSSMTAYTLVIVY